MLVYLHLENVMASQIILNVAFIEYNVLVKI